MLDLKVLKLTIVQQNLFQQLPQFRNVPVPVADIVDPLILFSGVLYGPIYSLYQRPCLSETSCSHSVILSMIVCNSDRLGISNPKFRWVIGRPTSVSIRFSVFAADGVKRRMRRSRSVMTIGIRTQA